MPFWGHDSERATWAKNACTSVPTVFLGCGKTEFKLPVSFFVYPSENGIGDSIFVFGFPTTLKMELQLLFSLFVFLQFWATEF